MSKQSKDENSRDKHQHHHIHYIPLEKGIEIGNRVIEKYKEALQELAKR